MIIKNYGRYWERQQVNWGKQGRGQRGHLKGYINVRDEPTDFREQIGIYVLHDDNLNVVYIGQTGSGTKRLFSRLNDHETDRLWNRWDHLLVWFSRCDGLEQAFRPRQSHQNLQRVGNGTLGPD